MNESSTNPLLKNVLGLAVFGSKEFESEAKKGEIMERLVSSPEDSFKTSILPVKTDPGPSEVLLQTQGENSLHPLKVAQHF